MSTQYDMTDAVGAIGLAGFLASIFVTTITVNPKHPRYYAHINNTEGNTMNKLEGIYNQAELAQIAATAQHLANQARIMSSMLIYCDNPEWHAQTQQDELQAVFSDLHSVVLGLEDESAQESAESVSRVLRMSAHDLLARTQKPTA